MEKQAFNNLVDRYLAGTATNEERRIVEETYARLAKGSSKISQQETERLEGLVMQGVLERTGIKIPIGPEPQMIVPTGADKSRSIYSKTWLRYAVAALIIFGVSGWFFFIHIQNPEELAALPGKQRFKNDIAPASQGVILNLGNDQQIRLDTINNGALVLDDLSNIQKKDNELTYTRANGHVRFHTITTGKGNNYSLTLADGSRVWLDAESSLYFPTEFAGNYRVVEVTGQAYFEVAKDSLKPFQVRFHDQVVDVIGTHFNIDAYDKLARTTLLEGSIRVTNTKNQTTILSPGEQIRLLPDGAWRTTRDADIDEVMAWKNGLFRFNGASIKDIMQQLERWYEIKVEYADNLKHVALVAKINRNEKISTILNLLEMTNQIQFIIEENKVTVINADRSGP